MSNFIVDYIRNGQWDKLNHLTELTKCDCDGFTQNVVQKTDVSNAFIHRSFLFRLRYLLLTGCVILHSLQNVTVAENNRSIFLVKMPCSIIKLLSNIMWHLHPPHLHRNWITNYKRLRTIVLNLWSGINWWVGDINVVFAPTEGSRRHTDSRRTWQIRQCISGCGERTSRPSQSHSLWRVWKNTFAFIQTVELGK